MSESYQQTYFIDRALGKSVGEALQSLGVNVKFHHISRADMVYIFVNTIEKIERITQGNQAPFIAKIYKNSNVKLWKNRVALNKILLNR